MDRVKQIASGLKNAEVFTPSAAAETEWNNLLKSYEGKKIPDDVVKNTKMFIENKVWIEGVKKVGYNVLDLGGGTNSTFYNLEKNTIYGSNNE